MKYLTPLLLLILLVLGGLFYTAFDLRPSNDNNQVCAAPSDIIGGPFALVDQDGARVTDQSFNGKYRLVVFGFTFCPDICPMQLATASAALNKLGDKADRIAPLFITLDPARDTAPAIKEYMKSYPRFTGLTGNEAEIDAAAKAYKIFYQKVPNKEMPDAYTLDHTVRTFLMDPDGKFLEMYDRMPPADLAAKISNCIGDPT